MPCFQGFSRISAVPRKPPKTPVSNRLRVSLTPVFEQFGNDARSRGSGSATSCRKRLFWRARTPPACVFVAETAGKECSESTARLDPRKSALERLPVKVCRTLGQTAPGHHLTPRLAPFPGEALVLPAYARPHQHQDPAVLELDAGRLPAAVAGLDPLAVSTSPGTCGTSRARRCDGGRMRSSRPNLDHHLTAVWSG
jgi:hypothetical protein